MEAVTKRLISRLTPARLANMAGIFASYQASRLIGRPVHGGMPFSLAVEPTTHCNLRCPECPSGLRSFTRPTGMLQPALFRDLVDQAADTLTYLTFYFQGEPFLHEGLLDMVRMASERNIFTTTSTNAHFLDIDTARAIVRSGLDRLIISIDGTTQETYSAYRKGGRLEKVLEGTNQVIRWKRKLGSPSPHVVFQFLVVRHNEHQLDDIRRMAAEMGVDELVFKSAQVYDYRHGNDLIPVNTRYARYRRQANGTWEIRNRLDNQCWKMWHSCVVTWDGKVVPCCFDKDAAHIMGDLNTTGLRDIWRGPAYREFRTALLRSRSSIDICTNCSEGCKVTFSAGG